MSGKDYKVIYIGKYSSAEILTGNIKVAKRIFQESAGRRRTLFIEYFFEGEKYGYFKKFFGRETVEKFKDSIVMKYGILRMLLVLIKHKPRIVHIIIAERFAVFSFVYKMFSRAKFIFSLHGIHKYEYEYLMKTKKFFRWKSLLAEKYFLKYSDLILCLSDDSGKMIKSYYSVPDTKFRLVPNGADEVFHKSGINRKYNFSKNLKLVFISDYNRPEKGFVFLKDALEKIDFVLELYIINDKNDKPVTNNKNIIIHCVDKMPSDELAKFLTDKDIILCTSNYEHFSVAFAEAMASGLVPVTTRVNGASRYIQNNVNGFVIDYGNKYLLSDIICNLDKNRNILKEISEESSKIYETLRWDKIFDEYELIYNSMISK